MYLHTWFLHFVLPMWPPRSPCGENRVLRYGTVRYLCMRHYIMSAAFCYLSTGTYLCTYRSCLLLPSRYRGTVLRLCPPSHRKPDYFPSFPQRHPSLSLVHHTLSTLQHTSGRYLGNTRHTYINNQNPPPLSPSFCQAIQTTIIKQTAMCCDVQYPRPRNRKLLNRVRYCTSFLCRSHEMIKVGTCRYLAWFFFLSFSFCTVPYRTVPRY